ncbi:hypothetical protein WJX81_003115 [Elliptochloris bilobata]|uniref:Ubiquitin carboxyl-terminal hydrolase n=1 Tax=Elliptochloris bilobata TaxID=381761 RepID=A0AAW1RNE8_9CHLO
MGKKWIPIESNPAVLNDYAKKLGFDIGKYAFCDILGLDEELLAMVPSPVVAVILLFPVTDKYQALKGAEDEDLKAAGYKGGPASLYFMKQTISNACGTIGVLHAIGNNLDKAELEDSSFFQRFFADTKEMSPADRGAYLLNPPPDAPDLDEAHHAAAQEGATAPPPLEEAVNLHFAALVERDGRLWELDGCKSFPIDHGPTSPATLLHDAAGVARAFMASTESLSFTLLALAAPDQEYLVQHEIDAA